jgi:enolase-phosphatase E1
VTIGPAAAGARAILLDIEGTTTPVTFVTAVLFPYARRHLRGHLERHAGEPEYGDILERLRAEHDFAARDEAVPEWIDAPPAARVDSAVAFVGWLMDRDRKSTGLKELQGRIWEAGYHRGELIGEVFSDVRPALERWRDCGLSVGIFSSGSVLAQQLLFRYSSAGDLTGLLQWHFDTHIGAKIEPESYRRIAEIVGVPAATLLFLSDVLRELDAARTAGVEGRLVVRPGNAPIGKAHGYQTVHSLAAV